MAYVNSTDFDVLIQDINMQQIISNNEAIRDQAVNIAIGEARSYLVQKYQFDLELIKVGNSRDPQLLNNIIDIALYHLHSRLSPRNIPEIRTTRYENSVMWLKDCSLGNVTPKLLEIDATNGKLIRWNSNSKNQNNF